MRRRIVILKPLMNQRLKEGRNRQTLHYIKKYVIASSSQVTAVRKHNYAKAVRKRRNMLKQ